MFRGLCLFEEYYRRAIAFKSGLEPEPAVLFRYCDIAEDGGMIGDIFALKPVTERACVMGKYHYCAATVFAVDLFVHLEHLARTAYDYRIGAGDIIAHAFVDAQHISE